MRQTFKLAVLCLSLTFIFTSCVSKKKYTELMGNKESLDQMLADSKKKVNNLEGNLETLGQEKDQLTAEYDAAKEKWSGQLTELENSIKESEELLTVAQAAAKEKEAIEAANEALMVEIRKVFSPYEGNGLTLTEKNGRLYVSMASPITYKSGSTRVPKEHEQTIQNLASLLSGNPAISLMVEGHSDKTPVKAGARYGSNIELSMARANKVVRKLVKLGANPSQLTAVGRGDAMPAVEVDGYSSELHQMNRRTEFVVIPNVSNLYKIKSSGV